MAKMLTLVLLPMVLLTVVSVYYMANSIAGHIYSEQGFRVYQSRQRVCFSKRKLFLQLRMRIDYSLEMGRLVHFLQQERDMSVLYLSTIGAETTILLSRVYKETDEELDLLSEWPSEISELERSDNFASKKKFRRFLEMHRGRLNMKLNKSIYNEIDFYSNIIDVFHHWLQTSIATTDSGASWMTLMAYEKIIFCKQQMGVERALGTSFYAQGKFPSASIYEEYNRKVNIFKHSLRQAQNYSNIASFIGDEKILKIQATVGRMRRDIRHTWFIPRPPSLLNATHYFDNISLYFDRLLLIQKDLATRIKLNISKRTNTEVTSVSVSTVIIFMVICICPVIIRAVQMLTTNIQNYALCLVDKTKELNREKRRTDSLLHQMLPKAVADQLKAKKDVTAEYFKHGTIYFSDIADFIPMSSTCSPMQIVNILNSLYTVCDDRIGRYDVYKVETIGDCYMVASGVPRRNGMNHAIEIANMSLDLMEAAGQIEVSSFPGLKLKLRIGVHTGPVVAGVVGTTLPRYCLFGDTVNTASRLETHGKPDHIHVSSSTYNILVEKHCYRFESRGYIQVKGKGKILTYWLLGKDSPKQSPKSATSSFEAESSQTREIRSASTVTRRHVTSTHHGPPVTKECFAGSSIEGVAGTSSDLPEVYEVDPGGSILKKGNSTEVQPSLREIEQLFIEKEGQSPPIVQLVEGLHY